MTPPLFFTSLSSLKDAAACLRSPSCVQGKQKADRNRARVEENFLKQTHAQRQEAAQTRREEKKRAEKERIMNEEDPERQRRMEVRTGTVGLKENQPFWE